MSPQPHPLVLIHNHDPKQRYIFPNNSISGLIRLQLINCNFISSKKELGGSAILDLGVYVLQFAQFVFKEEPINVVATGELNENGVDLVDTVCLEYKGGRKAVLKVNSKVKLVNEAVVIGTKGRVTVNNICIRKLYTRPKIK